MKLRETRLGRGRRPASRWSAAFGGAVGGAVLLLAMGGAGEPERAPEPGGAVTVWRHEEWVAGLRHRGLDVRDALAVFGAVFERLPDAARVGPTENYYYWQMTADGRWLHGNIRLAVGGFERGELEFAYGEPRDSPAEAEGEGRFVVSRTLTAADGVEVEAPEQFSVRVTHRGKSVVFSLNRLAQELPPDFRLAPGERFLQRTEDESGLRFYLLYNGAARHFSWVLDETGPVAEHFHRLSEDVVIGRRTGFVFWEQELSGGRKVLASVQRASLSRNDYHDGPFDQLADNFVRGDGLRPFIEEAMPWLRGRIDPWGRFLDTPAPRRVALAVHGTHDRPEDALALVAAAKRDPDPLAFLARGGRPAEVRE